MATTIEKTGKTIEDALKAALTELGASEDRVEYEVLETPSKGFLGLIGTKPAKIRVTLKDIMPPPQPTPAPVVESKPIEEVKPIVENKPIDQPKPIDDVKTDDDQPVDQLDNTPLAEAIVDDEKTSDEPVVEIDESEVDITPKTDADVAADDEKVNEIVIERAENFLRDILSNMKLDVTVDGRMTEEGYILNISGEKLGILIGKHGQTLDALQYLVNLAANRREERRTRFIIDIENYREKRLEALENLAHSLAERAIKLRKDVRLEPMNRHERKVIHLTLQDNERVTTHSAGTEPYRYVIISPKKYGGRDNRNDRN